MSKIKALLGKTRGTFGALVSDGSTSTIRLIAVYTCTRAVLRLSVVVRAGDRAIETINGLKCFLKRLVERRLWRDAR